MGNASRLMILVLFVKLVLNGTYGQDQNAAREDKEVVSEPFKLELVLKDGSSVLCSADFKDLTIHRDDEPVAVPLERIYLVVFKMDSNLVTLYLKDGDIIGGTPEFNTLKVNTLMGSIRIDLEHLDRLVDRCFISATIPKEAELWNGNWYWFFKKRGMIWSYAAKEAKRLGGRLVVISSKEENDFISARAKYEPRPSVNMWLGVNDIETEGTWVDAEKIKASYLNWRPGEPNDSNDNEDAAHLIGFDGSWNDTDVQLKFRYGVEWGLEC